MKLLPCSFKELTGFECPGCGIQRSLIELLHGNLVESIQLFPALIPTIWTFAFLLIHLNFKIKKGSQVLLWSAIVNFAIMLASYIWKMAFS